MHTTTCKIVGLVTSLAWFAAQGALSAYDADVDSVAYKVILWQNGNPDNSSVVTGLYANLSSNGVAEHPECTVQVFKEMKDNDTRWTISVTPKGDFGVYSVTYPMLYLPRLKDGYLIYPRDMGQKMEGVFDKGDRPCAAGYNSEGEGKTKVDAIYYGRYPETEHILQMMLIENEEEGVMIWTQDGEAWAKDFVVSTRLDAAHKGQGLRLEVIHYPENTGQKGTGFKSPYPVLTTPYKGGWYNAAQIYRAWALKQPWCSKGKIYDRKNTPEWFKKTHFWSAGGWFYDMEKGFEMHKKTQEKLKGRDIGIEFTQWQKYFGESFYPPDYFPPHDEPAFKRIIASQAQGLHIGPYVTTFHARSEHYLYRYLQGWTARDVSGEPYHYYEQLARQHEIDPYCGADISLFKRELKQAWNGPVNEELINALDCFTMPESERKRYKKHLKVRWGKETNVIDKIVFYGDNHWLCPGYKRVINLHLWLAEQSLGTYGAHMQYFDVFPTPIFPCYDKKHGHPVGYGRWFTKGQHDLCAGILEKHPSAIILTEGMAEYMLDVIHAYFMKACHILNGVPLFATIYQGYVEYSAFPICGQDYQKGWEKAEDFVSFTALAIHLGYAGGGCIGPQVGLSGYEPDDVRWKFLNDTIDTRLKYRDYIAAGRRLKDPKVEGAAAREVRGWIRPGREVVPMNLAPVQASKWAKNGDETKGLLLISNASAEKQTVVVDGQKVELEPFAWKGIEIQIKQ